MARFTELIVGEYRRTIDDRHRLSIPPELATHLGSEESECALAKERPGCLSIWNAEIWNQRLQSGVRVIQSKVESGRLDDRMSDVQLFGRLLSTRHKNVQLAGRSRLVIPEGFREFLGVDPGGDVLIVGAGVCIEIWQVDAWLNCLGNDIPRFGDLLEELAG